MAQTRNIIADRFCYGQFVYQNPEERQLNEQDLYHLELTMMNTGARVLYVDCDESVLKKRLDDREEVTMKPIRDIRMAYEKVFSKSILPIINIDTSIPELGVSKFLKKEAYTDTSRPELSVSKFLRGEFLRGEHTNE